MTRNRPLILMSLLVPFVSSAIPAESPVPKEVQIAGALRAAPEDRRAEAAVWGYSDAGELILLREGTNELICVADQPGDQHFRAVCYHESLDPYIQRGRVLRAQGVEGPDSINQRHAEADAGKLAMPEGPAALYNLGGAIEGFDPETGDVEGAHWVWVVYTPWATEASTGLPTTPQAPGAPWIMRPGTASSHIMVVQPRKPKTQEGN